VNPEHVEIVKQGKVAIDQWRLVHPEARLDLSGAGLIMASLVGADLSGADLSGAQLDFASLVNADLTNADLSGARLASAYLLGADLSGADLKGTNLFMASLPESNLSNTCLSGAKLASANLTAARLTGATLAEADLLGSNLSLANLSGAELTGAKLYGTARDDWKIEGIKCRYIFWDQAGEERSPKDRDLEPGEFERLYAQLPTIEYVFENGINPVDTMVMDLVRQSVNEQNPELELRFDSIDFRGLQPFFKFIVNREEQKSQAIEAITREHEKLMGSYNELSARYDQLFSVVAGSINAPAPISIGPNSTVAIGPGSSVTINTEEYIGHLEEIEQAIKEAPPETLTDAAKREALDIVSGTFKDVAKGKAKEVAEAIIQLGIKAGPAIVNTPAYEFFKNLS